MPPMVSSPRLSGTASSRVTSPRGFREDVRLDRRAEGDHTVRIDVAQRGAPEVGLHLVPHERHPGRPAHQHDAVELTRVEVCVREGLLAGPNGAAHERPYQRVELVSLDGERGSTEGRAIKLDALEVRERLLGRPRQALRRGQLRGRGRVDTGALQERPRQRPIEVIPAQGRVPAGGQDLEHPLVQPQHAHVKGAAAEIVDGEAALAPPVEPVGQRRRRRLREQPTSSPARRPASLRPAAARRRNRRVR